MKQSGACPRSPFEGIACAQASFVRPSLFGFEPAFQFAYSRGAPKRFHIFRDFRNYRGKQIPAAFQERDDIGFMLEREPMGTLHS